MVSEREGGAGGVAVGVGVEVDADLVIAEAAQEAGEDGLGIGREALPVGGVVAGEL